MTALPQYQQLEAVGWYVERPGGAAREVLVSFGDASLVIQSFAEEPIAHWPLATLVELRGGPAMILAPDVDAPERLSIADRDMIDAVRAVRPGMVATKPPRRLGRTRRNLGAAAVAMMVATALWAAAPAALSMLAARAPAAARAALGDAAIVRHAGAALCDRAPARRALERLARALTPEAGGDALAIRITRVTRQDGALAVPAPGGRVLVARSALGDPAQLAGAVALAMAEAQDTDPTAAALLDAGLSGALAALGGSLGGPALVEAAARALATSRPAPDAARAARAQQLLARPQQNPLISAPDWRAILSICD